ncbi:MAG: HEPN domain-containing protein [Aquificae bacterium]|nr:HEPN domain-containing protein [Aquificota bacterium]
MEGDRYSLEDRLRFSELHYRKAKDILRGLPILLEHKLYLDLVSRAYYVAFNMSKSLLYLLGEDPVTHKGIRSLLHLRFSSEREMLTLFDQLFNYRQSADYDTFTTSEDITEKEATEVKQKAEKFFELSQELRNKLIERLKP